MDCDENRINWDDHSAFAECWFDPLNDRWINWLIDWLVDWLTAFLLQVSLVSAVIVLVVLVALGRFLQPLPKACLGAIIMVALINMLKGALEVQRLWKISLIDASIFMVTLLATLLLDVDYGLAIGVLYSLLVFAFRMQYSRVSVLGKVRGTLDDVKPVEDSMVLTGGRLIDWLIDCFNCIRNSFCSFILLVPIFFSRQVEEVAGVKIFRLHGPLYSGNAESFVAKIRKAIISNEAVVSSYLSPVPEPEFTELQEIDSDNVTQHGKPPALNSMDITVVTRRQDAMTDGALNTVQNNLLLSRGGPMTKPLRAIVIDCSAINFMDVVATETLLRLAKECNKKGIRFIFAACNGNYQPYENEISCVLNECRNLSANNWTEIVGMK